MHLVFLAQIVCGLQLPLHVIVWKLFGVVLYIPIVVILFTHAYTHIMVYK